MKLYEAIARIHKKYSKKDTYIYGAVIADSEEEAIQKYRGILDRDDIVYVTAIEQPKGVFVSHDERHW